MDGMIGEKRIPGTVSDVVFLHIQASPSKKHVAHHNEIIIDVSFSILEIL